MQKLPKYLYVAAIVLWSVAALALLLLLSARLLLPQPQIFDTAGQGWVLPVWIASIVVVLVSLILCKALYKKEKGTLIPFALSLIGAGISLVVAVHLKGLLPEIVGLQYETQGLSNWKLIWRHLTPVFAGVLIAVVSWMNHVEARRLRIAAENASYKSVFDLPEDPVFHAAPDEEENAPRRLKKSLRRKKNK